MTSPDTQPAYEKTLRWWDGFTISLSIPAALFISLGYGIGFIGAWTALALLGTVAVVACLQNYIYSEMAGMFSDKVGGISMYANQGWRRKTTLAGPLATYGYWFAWSSSLAIYGLQIGSLVQAEWFPGQTWTFSTGLATIGFPHMVALGVLLLGWALNVLGMRPAMWIMYATGILVLIPLVLFAAAPLISGDWSISNLHWDLAASGFPGWRTAIAWMFVFAWSVYGIEAVATFVPEFRDTNRDTRIALRLAGIFVIVVYLLVPLGVGGLTNQADAAADPVSFYLGAFEKLIPGSAWLMTVCLIAGLLLLMVMTTADGGRVLHGSALEGLTIKQLGQLNRFKVPGRAMTLDLVVNVVLILFVGQALAVIVAGILGYLICHVLALTGFINLRREQPDANRPIKLGRQWIYIAGVLAAFDTVLVAVGALSAQITGYGGIRELLIGVVVLSISVLLFAYRQIVQEGNTFQFKATDEHSASLQGPKEPKTEVGAA
ncbi:APC family permease [Mycolicibacterium komossense]|uniref:APC family permease n=1 Tax=Mycolicibacterium komossense TaxID=1779 RepID=A0ABT3CB55_9MYCO|nr:APC family permease [Mycolicibacterium komossense]MCV7226667.1 APC family permease [Mycolicibacterium komossense]